MSSSDNDRPSTTPPQLQSNSHTENTAADNPTILCGSPGFDVSRPLIASPLPVASPRSHSASRPGTADPQYYESTDRLTVPDPRLFNESRSLSRLGYQTPSQRTSYSSDAESRNSQNYPFPPYVDARSSEDGLNTQTVAQKFAIVPDQSLIIRPDEVEKDDDLHNPDPNEKDIDMKLCTPRGVLNLGGLLLLVLGLLTLMVALPIISFFNPSPGRSDPCDSDPLCLNAKDVPLLKNIRTGLIDPDTPESAKKIKSAEGKEWELVFSDEFNRDGRTFFEGDDPYFQAVDIWYGVTQDLEWYDPDAVTTKDGVLEIRFDAYQNHFLNYRSGMVQSWNQLCFTGGRIEASISLPGRGDVVGLWPGFWTMGNLGRPGYAATTEGMWPYSYSDVCDAGITPNQSSPDGLSYLPGMKLPACTCEGEDHPTPGKSRSAPEIDVLEASAHTIDEKSNNVIGDVSQSCQIAPFDIWYMPNYEFMEVYDPRITMMNEYRGGPYQQAISGITNLNNDWYDGKAYQVYAFEYEPGADGYITWFVGQDPTWKLDGRALGPNGNIGQRIIPAEPMTIVMNLGMSHSFSMLNMTGLAPLLPAKMRFDYIRIYQDPDKKSVTCDPPGMETTEYIRKHKEPYMNQNLTSWEDTDYDWPRNSFIHGCDD